MNVCRENGPTKLGGIPLLVTYELTLTSLTITPLS